jgi:hypothetical protein
MQKRLKRESKKAKKPKEKLISKNPKRSHNLATRLEQRRIGE